MDDVERRRAAWRHEPEGRLGLLELQITSYQKIYEYAAMALAISERRHDVEGVKNAKAGIQESLAKIDEYKALLATRH